MTSPVQFQTVILPFDDKLTDELKKLEAQGFQQLPGTPPVVIYTVFRSPEQPPAQSRGDAHAGMVQMGIDDSNVHIIRNGQKVG